MFKCLPLHYLKMFIMLVSVFRESIPANPAHTCRQHLCNCILSKTRNHVKACQLSPEKA